MSPELDLLERLAAADASLHEAARGSGHAFRDLPHAMHVVSIYVRSGLVELYDTRSDLREALPTHAARVVLGDEAPWEAGQPYALRLTDEGVKQFREDSEGFFRRLFA